ncbi:MAG: hypothetical protein NUW06_02220 [Candidatus Acetothermia bacterium]|jgi:hypothetical protein|nr:hypothetical protein [Candidatus Acetothermia bacterium]MDH7504614.1 hypothetical protein [Candidatus Acetothermia bacterium]
MIVKLDGEKLEVADGLTFPELIAHVRSILKQRALSELRLNGATVSQALLDELSGRPIFGQIELFSIEPRELVAELARQGRRYLEQLAGVELTPEVVPGLLEGFVWLNQALALIPLGVGFPELQARVRELLIENRRLRERLSRSSEEGLEELEEELGRELVAYQEIFTEVGKRLERCGGDT